jgi:hypothetical protein
MMKRVLAGVLVAACGETVDEPFPDYTNAADPEGWMLSATVSGDAPGHSNSIRKIYTNAIARQPWLDDDGMGYSVGYRVGSTIVKEVFDDDNGQPGALRHIAIMRKQDDVKTGLSDEGGWLYTETFELKGTEKYYDFCWSRCHVAAPYNGAFYDFRME